MRKGEFTLNLQGGATVGQGIRRLRQRKNLTRQQLANILGVDVTSVCSWETGRYMPRESHRFALAAALGSSADILFPDAPRTACGEGQCELADTITEVPKLLTLLLARTRRILKAFRLAAPYSTPAHVQKIFREAVALRLVDRTLDVQCVEIVYELPRLKELLANIIRYDGCGYQLKVYCAGIRQVAPSLGGYIFDDREALVGAYWAAVPPDGRPSLRLSGEPFGSFFAAYWDEVWRRGALLNIRGAHDISAVREIALALGLAPQDWPQFVEEARGLTIGDGAPPLV